MPTLPFSGLKASHGICSCAPIESPGPLGCPLLEGLKDPSLAFGGPLLPTPTSIVMSVTTLFPSIITRLPQLDGTTGLLP